MARMKRFANRYGKVTLASLGGCLMTLGAFLISLSAANVAEASTSECDTFSSPQPNYECTAVDMYGDGSYIYYSCCHECGSFPVAVANDPSYDCTACYDYSGDGIDDWCDCCTAGTAPPPGCGKPTGANCDNGCSARYWTKCGVGGHGVCRPTSPATCATCLCLLNDASNGCECK
jgi:hypothetical protein